MHADEILLVEDNPADVLLTRRALEKAKITAKLVVARDGIEALANIFPGPAEQAEKGTDCPLLVLMDINLPKINGLEVLKRLRNDERTCLCPVVILTSSGEEADVVAGYKTGANSYIRKPVDFYEFVEAVRQLGLYWLILNEPPPLRSR